MQNRHSRQNNADGAAVRLLLLGPMQVHVGDGQVELSARKARGLLAYLALRHGEAVPRETIVGLFWGGREEKQARASLRQTLSAIRKALGKDAAESLITTNESVTLAGENISFDVAALDKEAKSSTTDELIEMAGLYRGDLLEGFSLSEPEFDQWLSAERERARSGIFSVLFQLIKRMEEDQRIEEAITYAARLLTMDSLQEHVHCKLMRLYMAQGRYDVALNQFEQCRRELAEQLDVAPEQATLDIVKEIRARRRQIVDGNGEGKNTSDFAKDTGEKLSPSIQVPSLPDKPSIAVLPFTNMSNDAEQEFFSDGMTEDIITELSRFDGLFVIARNSSFAFKGKSVDIKEAGRLLGVQYLLEGSVRKSGNHIRVTAQLVDAATSDHIWAERYDRELNDIFEIQDDLTRSIVTTLKGRIDVDLAKHSALKPTSNLSAYECVLRAQSLVHRYREEDFSEARELLEKAISLDPKFARAYGWLAYVEAQDVLYWRMSNEALQKAVEIGEKGLALDNNESKCHLALGLSFLFKKNYDKSEHHLTKASLLNPNDDLTMVELSRFKMYTGNPDQGAELIRRGMRQNPYHPNWYWNVLARCFHTAKDYQNAIFALDHIETTPFWSHAYYAACFAELGQMDKAREHVDHVLSLKPDFSIKQFEKIVVYRDPNTLEDFFSSLRKAGLP